MTSGYAARARHYAAEIGNVPPPGTLAALLRPGLTVAEMPSGTGHFLSAYAAAGAEVTLIDVCSAMLEAARRHAAAVGMDPVLICAPIQDLTAQTRPFDLVVVPNAALNQLAADANLADLLAVVAQRLRPGGRLLAQVLDPAGHQACGFYDPTLGDGTWCVDRRFADEIGRPLIRRRRQQHFGGLIRIDFELHRDGVIIYRHHVVLRPLATAVLRIALGAAGFTELSICPALGPSGDGLFEIHAVRASRSPR